MSLVNLLPIAGYLVGSFPTGVVLTRRRFGIDVREMGSGNIGATNVTRTFGWQAGILTFVVDFLKGYVPLILLKKYFPEDPWVLTITGFCIVLGHCSSIFLGFRGGKGVATGAGCIAAVAWAPAILGAVGYLGALLVTRISAVGSLVGLGLAALSLVWWPVPFSVRMMILSIGLLVLFRHASNIQRLWSEWRQRRRK